MSDGITDAYRDEKRANLEEEISKVELNLVLAGRATRKDIKELLELWEDWVSIRQGYWTISNKKIYEQRKTLYEKMLKDGEVTIRIREGAE